MAELKIEVTEELDQELKGMADAQLVTKEDMARGILANCILREKRQKKHKSSFFGLDLAVVGQALQTLGDRLVETAREKGKEEEP
ncbi:hypothetical protein ES703_06133 [subsurface metagenome]